MKEYRSLSNDEKQKVDEEIKRLHEEECLGNSRIKRYLSNKGIQVSGATIEMLYNPEYKNRRYSAFKKRREEYEVTAFTKEYKNMTIEEKQKVDEEIKRLHNKDKLGNCQIRKHFQNNGIKISHPTIKKIIDSNYQDKIKNKAKSYREKYRQILTPHSDEILQIYKQNQGKSSKEIADEIRRILPNVPNGLVNDLVDGLDAIVFNGVQQNKRNPPYYLGISGNEIRKSLGLNILRERGKQNKILEYLKQKGGVEETAVIETELKIDGVRKNINMLSEEKIKSIRPLFALNTNNVCYLPEKEDEARERVKKMGAINFKRSVEKSIASVYRNSATMEKARSLTPTLQRYFDKDSIFTAEDLKNESGVTDTTNSGKCVADSLIKILLHSKGSFFNYNQFYSFSQQSLEDFKQLDLSEAKV